MSRRRSVQPAFSLVELVIVVVIIGMVAAIAVPRLSSAAERSKAGALAGDLAALSKAIEHYAAEHSDLSPAESPGAGVSSDGVQFANRLTGRTDQSGMVIPGAMFGPYLLDIPSNPYNTRKTVRIDGLAAGANIAGWRYDSGTRLIASDHAGAGAGVVSLGGGAIAADDGG